MNNFIIKHSNIEETIVMNFSLEQNVDILAYHVERFTYLRDNEQYQDADAIAQEYICNGEVEDDNYQWLYVNYQFEEQTNEIYSNI